MSETRKGRVFRTVGVSLPPELEAAGRARAKALRLAFSRYVQLLVLRDVRQRGALIIEDARELGASDE